MGKVYSTLTRPVRSFNIANRAEKVISREKPVPAPQYETTEKQKKLSSEVNPHFLEDHYRKDGQLDQRLKDVFVTSTDPQAIKEPMRESKPLPQNRSSLDDESPYEPYYGPVMIPAGKCSLKQAFAFLLQHRRDPVTYSSKNIASEYKMDKKVVDDILKHFKLYVTVTSNNPEVIEDPIQEMIDERYGHKKEKAIEKKK